MNDMRALKDAAVVPQKQKQVVRYLERVESQISLLSDKEDSLRDMLKSVLCLPEDGKEGILPPISSLCPLGERLYLAEQAMIAINQRLQATLDALQI